MCQVNEEDDEAFQALKSSANKSVKIIVWKINIFWVFYRTLISRKCMSCDQDAFVVVRIADPMCRWVELLR
jgi:hypothetical protein